MNLKNFRHLIIILLAVILVCGCSAAPKKPDPIIPGIYDYAKEYISWLTRKEMKQLPLRDVAAGSMYSNVLDLSRFMQTIFANGVISDRQIIQPDTIDEMLRPQNEAVSLDFEKRIGLGWFLSENNETNEKIAFHTGGSPLFHTALLIFPEKKIGVGVLTNSAEGSQIHGKIAKEALKLALEAKTGKAPEKKEHQITAPDEIVSEEMLQTFVGRYATLNMLGSIERKKNTLDANMGNYKFRLIPSSDGKFGVKRKLLGIFPLKKIGSLELAKIRTKIRTLHMDFAGRELLIVQYNNRHWFSAEKIDPSPLPDTWKNALGEYQLINPDPEGSPQDIALSNEDGVLVFSYNLPLWNARKEKLYLTPISETEAITLGIGRSSGEAMRIVNKDNEEKLYFWGFKMKKKPS